MSNRTAVILGGGINGLTCGLTLQRAGYSTHLITSSEWKNGADDPYFSSLYPASSIKPVTVISPILNELLRESQQRFSQLLNEPDTGVRQLRHYEVHEYPEKIPEYAREMSNFRVFNNGSSTDIPRRGQHIATSGWSYDVLFADTPVYLTWLQIKYLEAGGEIRVEYLSRDDIPNLPEPIIINCTGTGTVGLFDDDIDDIRFVKGHQIILNTLDIPEDHRSRDLSYNYTAGKTIYRNPDGGAADVYFYPRRDCWIIGTSRQECRLDAHGNLTEELPVHESIVIGNVAVPLPMYDISRSILRETFGIEIEKLPMKARFGYRFIRKSRGLRLEKEVSGNQTIIHNYGHGGAGVTLSWGCAAKVLEMVR